MKQDEKDLLLKDICGRLDCGVKVRIYNHFYDDFFDEFITIKNISSILERFDISDIKPYLYPLSSMTEEQEEEYNNLNCYELGCFPHLEEALDYLMLELSIQY